MPKNRPMFPDGICRSPVTWNDSTPDHYVRILSHLNEVAQLRYGKCIIQHVIVAEDEDIITMDILGMVLDVGEHATHIQTGMIVNDHMFNTIGDRLHLNAGFAFLQEISSAICRCVNAQKWCIHSRVHGKNDMVRLKRSSATKMV